MAENKIEKTLDAYIFFLKEYCLRALQVIAGDSSKVRGLRLLVYAFRNLLSAIVMFIAFEAFVALMSYFGIRADSGIISEVFGYLIGVPVMLGLVYFCLESLRLFTLGIMGRNGSEELHGALRIIILFCGVIMFFAGGAIMLNINMMISKETGIGLKGSGLKSNRQIKEEFAVEQNEYMKMLDKPADEWNKYINATPMHYITFAGCNLDGRDLRDREFHNVKFNNASLKNTNFDNCYLTCAVFDGADCSGATFRRAYLMMVSFANTNLAEADLSGAYIDRAILQEAKTSKTNLEGATYRFDKSPWRQQKDLEYYKEKLRQQK